MNFQAVDQANGKNVTMWAKMDTWEGYAFTPNQAKYLSCKLTDDDGVGHNCRIYEGKGSCPGQEHLEKKLEFSLSCYQGNYKGNPYTGYSGFWSHGATKSPQDSPQSPPQPAQATKPSQQGDNDVEIRKCIVCAYLARGGDKPLVENIEYWMAYIKTGKDASLPGNKSEPEGERSTRVTDDDIPW